MRLYSHAAMAFWMGGWGGGLRGGYVSAWECEEQEVQHECSLRTHLASIHFSMCGWTYLCTRTAASAHACTAVCADSLCAYVPKGAQACIWHVCPGTCKSMLPDSSSFVSIHLRILQGPYPIACSQASAAVRSAGGHFVRGPVQRAGRQWLG